MQCGRFRILLILGVFALLLSGGGVLVLVDATEEALLALSVK